MKGERGTAFMRRRPECERRSSSCWSNRWVTGLSKASCEVCSAITQLEI